MTLTLRSVLVVAALISALGGFMFPIEIGGADTDRVMIWPHGALLVFAGLAVLTAMAAISDRLRGPLLLAALFLVAHFGAYALISSLGDEAGKRGPGFWSLVIAAWALAWLLADRVAAIESRDRLKQRLLAIAIPALFGMWILILWEIIVRGFDIPAVLLPPPSAIGARIATSVPTLWADFQQTILKAVLIGYILGCGAGLVVAILIDRSSFLQRGLLPIGNLVSALPIVGVAPIMVMWFGFDWPSKAAVVIIMTFFPMLVNTVAGLASASAMQRDLMKTYAASYWQTLFKLRLPEALPFIFNALKINSTLALIGAIVAEFFGTPIVGMGFRISTEVGRMNIDMVWAEIAMAAVAGSLFYGAIALTERVFTFWHPSIRGS